MCTVGLYPADAVSLNQYEASRSTHLSSTDVLRVHNRVFRVLHCRAVKLQSGGHKEHQGLCNNYMDGMQFHRVTSLYARTADVDLLINAGMAL